MAATLATDRQGRIGLRRASSRPEDHQAAPVMGDGAQAGEYAYAHGTLSGALSMAEM